MLAAKATAHEPRAQTGTICASVPPEVEAQRGSDGNLGAAVSCDRERAARVGRRTGGAGMSEADSETSREAGGQTDWRPLTGDGFMATVGPLLVTRRADGSRTYSLETDERHRNAFGIVHGGVIMSAFDHALGVDGGRSHDAPGQATIQLNVSFVDAVAVGERIEIACETVRTARSVMFVRGTATVGPRVVATAEGVWKLRRGAAQREGGQGSAS